MVRKTALVTAMLGAFASQAFAMGLGEIRLNSVLNQPFNAEIELLSPTPADIAELRVNLASPEAYAKAGVQREFFHTKMRFEVVPKPDGSAVIKITSREPVREPYLDFLLKATWGSGQVLREYTVLVDPPALMPGRAPVMQAPTVAQPITRAPAPAPVQVQPSYQPPARAVPQGYTGGEYRTSRNDTLWKIAAEVRPDASLTMEQTMLGLLEANPGAFYDQNINNLKAGHILRVPSQDEFAAVTQRDAMAEVRRQNRVWRDGRSAAKSAPESATTSATAAGGESAAAKGAQLKLLAPEGAADGAGGDGAAVDDLRNELTLAVEAVEAQRQENQDLSNRLIELEEQVSKLHRLIELKDDELAKIGGTAVPAPAVTAEAPAGEDVPAVPAVEGAEEPAEAPVADADMAAAPTDTAPMPSDVEGAEEVTAEEPGIELPTPDTAMDAEEMPAVPEVAVAEPEPMPVPSPAPMEAPAPKVEDQGLLAKVLGDPMLKWGAVGGAVVLALLALIGLRRRRSTDSEFGESILAERASASVAAAASAAPVAAETAASKVESAAEEVTEQAAKASTQTDSSLFTDFAVSDLGTIQSEDEADPIAEADVYLAYGRYQQAEELVRGAIGRTPQRNDLKLKLLEILFAAKNSSAFDAEAEGLLAALDGQDDEMWQRVAEMGRELNPSNPLYKEGGAGAAAAAGGVAAAATLADEASDTLTDRAAPDDLAFDAVDLGETAAEAEMETPTIGEDDHSLDFDLGEFESFAKPEAESAASADTADEMSFDLTTGGDEAEAEVADEGALEASDEVSTKLDLARAYMEMGDPEGARGILEEVLEEGNDAQKSEAQSLLQKVS